MTFTVRYLKRLKNCQIFKSSVSTVEIDSSAHIPRWVNNQENIVVISHTTRGSLDLSENLLSGLLPSDELSSLSGLQHFSVSRRTKSGRKIPGPLPPFNELPALLVLALDDNSFSGPIPVDFIAASMHVQSVDISRNRLSGLVPPNLSSVPGVKMDFLENDWNVLTDAVPGTLSKANERGILVDLFKTSGGNLWLRNDFWNSNVDFCSWNGVGCNEGRVILINLQSNNLVGTLPRQIFDLPLLQMLWLSENPKFEVKFENLRNVSNLLDLKVDGTSTKSLKGIRNAKSLTYLDASNNKLAGNFPNELFALENLRLLSLSNNSFYGALPESLSSFRYLRVFEAESNSFTGWLPSFSDSIALSKVNLGYNDLKGKIPRDFLDRVPNFTSLNISLQGNKLTGSIPQEFQRFAIVNININGNQIDTIPSVLCDRSGWNDGAVGKYGCNGLACAPGTTNLAGRQSFEFPVCVKCPAAAPFFGQVNCVGTMRSSSATYSTGSLIPWVMLLLASGFSLF